jgi:hypothetical protein
MKAFLIGISVPFLFLFQGCATTGTVGNMTSAQAVAIAQPFVSGGLTLILQNNPTYIPLASQVGADLTSSNFNDLTITGINLVVSKAVAARGGTPALAAILEASVDAGLGAYLENVGEAALANDPNAQTILKDLGAAITTGANAAQANPK